MLETFRSKRKIYNHHNHHNHQQPPLSNHGQQMHLYHSQHQQQVHQQQVSPHQQQQPLSQSQQPPPPSPLHLDMKPPDHDLIQNSPDNYVVTPHRKRRSGFPTSPAHPPFLTYHSSYIEDLRSRKGLPSSAPPTYFPGKRSRALRIRHSSSMSRISPRTILIETIILCAFTQATTRPCRPPPIPPTT